RRAASPAGPSGGRASRWLPGVAPMVAVLSLALYVASHHHASPVLWPDACGYLSAARVLVQRGRYGLDLVQLNPRTLAAPPEIDPVGWWPPAYPVALALLSEFNAEPDHLLAAAHWLDLAGELAAAAGLGLLARLVVGEAWAGLLAGALYLLSGPSLSEAPRLLSEHLFMAFVAWACLSHLLAIRGRHTSWAVAAGLLWGLAALTRHWGLVLVLCATGATFWALRGQLRHRGLRGAGVPIAVAVALWGAWALRDWLVGGMLSGNYAPGSSSPVPEFFLAVGAYLYGFVANPIGPAALPVFRTVVCALGAVVVLLNWKLVMTRFGPGASPKSEVAERWLLAAAVLFTATGVFGPALLRSLRFINVPLGRFMMPPVALSLVAFCVVAARCQKPLALAALAAVIVAGGGEQGLSNLLRARGWALADDCRPLARDAALREALAGERVLLLSREGLRPVPDMVQAAVFLPTAATVYWPDSPLYTGITLEPQQLHRFVEKAGVRYVLLGPRERRAQSGPADFDRTGPIGRWRSRVRNRAWAIEKREIDFLRRFLRPSRLRLRPRMTVGQWELAEIVGFEDAASSTPRGSPSIPAAGPAPRASSPEGTSTSPRRARAFH
ncbi:MAG: glycosyltransferase family 39 protein, partial [Armatimonadetes bacterium]|nr:glycosyltransferase family 39 protein [Armatimonadota bacterium]